MRLVLLTVVARTSCGAPVASSADPCAPLPPLAEGVPVRWESLFAPDGFTFVGVSAREDAASLKPGTYVDVVLAAGEPTARTIARDGLFLSARRETRLSGGVWEHPLVARLLTDDASVPGLIEASASGSLALVPSDERRSSASTLAGPASKAEPPRSPACDPGVRELRRAWIAALEPGRPKVRHEPRPPASTVELEVQALQSAAWLDPRTFVDVVLEPAGEARTIARGAWFEAASWPGGPTPVVDLVVDRDSAEAIREAVARGWITLVPAAEGTGLAADPEVRAWAADRR